MANKKEKSLKLNAKGHNKNKFHIKMNKSRKMQKKLRGPLPPNRPPPSTFIYPTETPKAQAIRPDLSNVGKIGIYNIHRSAAYPSFQINLFWITLLTFVLLIYLKRQ